MREPVCLLLPVHEAESWLAGEVSRILELLCEFDSRNRLVIIDDGSLDETAAEARLLATKYPQVGVRRHPLRYGSLAALQTGLRATSRRLVLVADDNRSVTFRNLNRLLGTSHGPTGNLEHTPNQVRLPRVSSVRYAGSLRLLVRETAAPMAQRCSPPIWSGLSSSWGCPAGQRFRRIGAAYSPVVRPRGDGQDGRPIGPEIGSTRIFLRFFI